MGQEFRTAKVRVALVRIEVSGASAGKKQVAQVGGFAPNMASPVWAETAARQAQLGDRKSTRLNSSHTLASRMPSSA